MALGLGGQLSQVFFFFFKKTTLNVNELIYAVKMGSCSFLENLAIPPNHFLWKTVDKSDVLKLLLACRNELSIFFFQFPPFCVRRSQRFHSPKTVLRHSSLVHTCRQKDVFNAKAGQI